MLDEYYIDDAYYRFLRKRWADTRVGELDAELLKCLELFNQIEGLVTIWSCASHSTNHYHEEGHVILGVAEEKAARILFDIYDRFHGVTRHSGFNTDWPSITMEMGYLNRLDTPELLKRLFDREVVPIYPFFKLGFTASNTNRTDTIKLLENAIAAATNNAAQIR